MWFSLIDARSGIDTNRAPTPAPGHRHPRHSCAGREGAAARWARASCSMSSPSMSSSRSSSRAFPGEARIHHHGGFWNARVLCVVTQPRSVSVHDTPTAGEGRAPGAQSSRNVARTSGHGGLDKRRRQSGFRHEIEASPWRRQVTAREESSAGYFPGGQQLPSPASNSLRREAGRGRTRDRFLARGLRASRRPSTPLAPRPRRRPQPEPRVRQCSASSFRG